MAVAADRGHHFSKPLRDSITLIEGRVEGDAHSGTVVRHRYLARRRPSLPNLRQVHLIPAEIFADLRSAGYDLHPGELGENVTTAGIELERLALGTLLKLGETAVIGLTGLRTPCILIDRFRTGLRDCMMRPGKIGPRFRCGVLGVVRTGGRVAAGDKLQAAVPGGRLRPLPAL